MFQLRYHINQYHYEIVGNYPNKQLAYGIRKKLAKEQPQRYSLNKLTVNPI